MMRDVLLGTIPKLVQTKHFHALKVFVPNCPTLAYHGFKWRAYKLCKTDNANSKFCQEGFAYNAHHIRGQDKNGNR